MADNDFGYSEKTVVVHDGDADAIVQKGSTEDVTIKDIGQRAVIRYYSAEKGEFVSGFDISKTFVHDGQEMMIHNMATFDKDSNVLSERSIITGGQEGSSTAVGTLASAPDTAVPLAAEPVPLVTVAGARKGKDGTVKETVALPDKFASGKNALPDDVLKDYKFENDPVKKLNDILLAVEGVKSR